MILCYLWYLLVVRNVPTNGSTGFAKFLFTNDVIRTVACGGWVYVTSSDDHDIHDIAMAVYLICTIPHVVMTITSAPQNPKAQQYRKLFAYTFFGALVPMIYFFIQHNVHRIPGGKKREQRKGSKWKNCLGHLNLLVGPCFLTSLHLFLLFTMATAYTYYAFFEWSLIISDLAFDAVCMIDFETFEFRVVDVGLNGKNEEGSAFSDLKTYGGKQESGLALVKPADAVSFAADVYLGKIFILTLRSGER